MKKNVFFFFVIVADPAPKINLQEVTTPCNPNPCPEEETCWVNRRKCRHPESCSPFVCHKGIHKNCLD